MCLRSTWDYHRRIDEFRAWLEAVALGCRLVNPLETVRWNLDKRYLAELERAGIAIPVTRWFEPGIRPDLAEVLEEEGWDQAVLKPRISATAWGTHLVQPASVLTMEEWKPALASGAMVQHLVPEIRTAGEISLVFVAGRFSHAVSKRSTSGDYRIQQEFGGVDRPIDVSGSLIAFGERVLAAAARPWTYARVDLVETARGPVLMEVELIEPELFFALAAAAAERLAEALLAP